MVGRLIHYSKSSLTELRPIDPGVRPNGKPVGLWLSVEGEDDWKSWCEAEEFHLESLAYAHEVVLKPDAHILRLSGPVEIDGFTERYSKPCEWSSLRREINWERVMSEYQGIIIAPYCWQRRMTEHTFWYYSWDCASGCIWDVKAIQIVTTSTRED